MPYGRGNGELQDRTAVVDSDSYHVAAAKPTTVRKKFWLRSKHGDPDSDLARGRALPVS